MREYDPTNVKNCKLLASLSPNIASLQSCYGYSFLGVLGEVRPCDVGIETDQAFRVFMLPQSLSVTGDQWAALMTVLQRYHVRSQRCSYYSTRKKMELEGLSLFIDDISKVSNFELILEIIQWALKNGIPLQYSEGFDKAIGTKKIREWCKKKIILH